MLGVALGILLGCAPTGPVTSGFQATTDPTVPPPSRFLVWSNDPTVEPLLVNWLQDQGRTVLEPASVHDVLTEQHLTLSPGPTIEQDLVRVARLVGADRVLVAGVTTRSHAVYWVYSGHKEGGERVNTIYDPTVTVRCLNVTTGEISWSVTASGSDPTFVPQQTITELTSTALLRATCEADPSHEWRDEGGCREKP